jgi:hypothetical protein
MAIGHLNYSGVMADHSFGEYDLVVSRVSTYSSCLASLRLLARSLPSLSNSLESFATRSPGLFRSKQDLSVICYSLEEEIKRAFIYIMNPDSGSSKTGRIGSIETIQR